MISRLARTIFIVLILLSVGVIRAASLSEVQSQVFSASCTSCHSGSSPSQGLNLSAGAAYGNTVNVPSTQVPSLDLVEPGDADSSYLMQKLEGTAQTGAQMPNGGPYLNSTLRQLVRDWIDAGAQNIATDTDGDGIEDDADNCSSLTNADQLDTDSDGSGNACDTDDDGDGVADGSDAFPLDSAETLDTDSDGTGNNADTDDDGDSVLDTADAFPLISVTGETDTDADGAPNTCDSDCLTAGMTADTDDDGDGTLDTADAFPLDSAETTDTDSDGTGNNADTDDDGDGVADGSDAFPLDTNESVDTDGDAMGNNADTDDDGDGVSDAQEATDGTDPLDKYSCNGCFDFDIDVDGETAALTDGLLILRHLFGFAGATLTEGAVTSSATRSDANTIASYLDTNSGHVDIDGDGSTEALTDGLLLLRYLFGFDGATLIEGAVSASATRTTSEEIKTYIQARIATGS